VLLDPGERRGVDAEQRWSRGCRWREGAGGRWGPVSRRADRPLRGSLRPRPVHFDAHR